ncbi:MAG TPA: ABC transporter substrate-binding protein [Ruminococcaceae bacterium]|nr:ABC transporter substrate-binding protein [Oscillospiraceae bacterium]
MGGKVMKTTKFKILSLLLCGFMLLSSVACSAGNTAGSATESGGGQKGGSELSGKVVFADQRDTTGAVQKSIESFQKENPGVTVDYQQLPGNSDDVKKSIMTSLAAGDSEPDVFSMDIIWVPQFASAGWLLDVTQDLEAVKDQYLEGPLSACYLNGKAYAFPNYTDVGLLYYRSDLVSTPPKTWDELVSMSKQHIGKDGIQYGFVYQAFQGEPIVCNSLEFIKQNGGKDLENGKFAFNSANTIEALKFMRSLIDQGITPEGVLSHKPDDSRAIFEDGKALFMRNWTYAYAPAQASAKVKGKVGVAALPVGPKGSDSSGTLGGWYFGVNKNSENKEAALALAKYLAGEVGQKDRTLKASTFPTLKATYDDPEVKSALPYLSDLRSAADKAKPRPQVPDYPAISSIMQVYLHKAMTGVMKYEDAMAEMTQKLDSAYASQKK